MRHRPGARVAHFCERGGDEAGHFFLVRSSALRSDLERRGSFLRTFRFLDWRNPARREKFNELFQSVLHQEILSNRPDLSRSVDGVCLNSSVYRRRWCVFLDVFEYHAFWTYLLFMQNFWMAHAGIFGGGWLAATWSLAVEEQFYLTLPSIIRFFSRRVLYGFVFLGIALAPVVRVLLFRSSHDGWLGSYVLLFCRADALLFGVVCAILLRNANWRQKIASSKYLLAGVLMILLGVAAFLTKIHADLGSYAMASYGFTVLAAQYACLLLLVCTHQSGGIARVARLSPLRWLGSIAYGAYLFHMPVQGLLFATMMGGKPRIVDAASFLLSVLAVVLTLGLAHVSWNFFEKRLVKFSHRAQYQLSPLEQRVAAVIPAGAQQ